MMGGIGEYAMASLQGIHPTHEIVSRIKNARAKRNRKSRPQCEISHFEACRRCVPQARTPAFKAEHPPPNASKAHAKLHAENQRVGMLPALGVYDILDVRLGEEKSVHLHLVVQLKDEFI